MRVCVILLDVTCGKGRYLTTPNVFPETKSYASIRNFPSGYQRQLMFVWALDGLLLRAMENLSNSFYLYDETGFEVL